MSLQRLGVTTHKQVRKRSAGMMELADLEEKEGKPAAVVLPVHTEPSETIAAAAATRPQGSNSVTRPDHSQQTCWVCYEQGHIASRCPVKERKAEIKREQEREEKRHREETRQKREREEREDRERAQERAQERDRREREELEWAQERKARDAAWRQESKKRYDDLYDSTATTPLTGRQPGSQSLSP